MFMTWLLGVYSNKGAYTNKFYTKIPKLFTYWYLIATGYDSVVSNRKYWCHKFLEIVLPSKLSYTHQKW
jgi:hypothetical protein